MTISEFDQYFQNLAIDIKSSLKQQNEVRSIVEIDKNKFLELVEKNYTNKQLTEYFRVNINVILRYRKKFQYEISQFKKKRSIIEYLKTKYPIEATRKEIIDYFGPKNKKQILKELLYLENSNLIQKLKISRLWSYIYNSESENK